MEEDGCLPFLDIMLCRRSDGLLQPSVCGKSIATRLYIRFDSFVQINYKKRIMPIPYDRKWKLCSYFTFHDEYSRLTAVFKTNGYPECFIRRNSQPPTTRVPIQQAEPKAVYIRLPFRGDDVTAIVTKRLISAVKRVFYAAKPVIIYETTRMPVRPAKDSVPFHLRSHCIYQYSCGCGSTYIGVTERHLQSRIAEHLPKWVTDHVNGHATTNQYSDQTRRLPASAIARHVLENHGLNFTHEFSVVFSHQNKRILQYAEALIIKRLKPELCVQKDLFVKLALPW